MCALLRPSISWHKKEIHWHGCYGTRMISPSHRNNSCRGSHECWPAGSRGKRQRLTRNFRAQRVPRGTVVLLITDIEEPARCPNISSHYTLHENSEDERHDIRYVARTLHHHVHMDAPLNKFVWWRSIAKFSKKLSLATQPHTPRTRHLSSRSVSES